MLVLSRKLGEKIYIGENICITVVDIDRGKIRLGIDAPRNVPIYRQELLPLKAGAEGAAPPRLAGHALVRLGRVTHHGTAAPDEKADTFG